MRSVPHFLLKLPRDLRHVVQCAADLLGLQQHLPTSVKGQLARGALNEPGCQVGLQPGQLARDHRPVPQPSPRLALMLPALIDGGKRGQQLGVQHGGFRRVYCCQ